MKNSFLFAFTGCLICQLLSATCWAQDNTVSADTVAQKTRAAKAEIQLTEAAVAQVLAFVREHHPEIEQYLGKLKEVSPAQFRKGVTEIAKVIHRLNGVKKRNPAQYEYQLAIWKIDSRAQLTAVRYILSQDKALMGELQKLIDEKIDLQHARILVERERLAARLAKIDEQLEGFDSKRQVEAERRLEKLLRNVGSQIKRIRQSK